jgi:nicotinic acid mononucleotide adenylyltransferase
MAQPIPYTNANTVVFTIARMNPPTPGHMELIRKLITTAADIGVNEVYLILSKTMDAKNPIACDAHDADAIHKKAALEPLIQHIKESLRSTVHINVICVPETNYFGNKATPFDSLSTLIYEKRDDVNVVALLGSDRSKMVDNIFSIVRKNPNVNSFAAMLLSRDGDGMETLKTSSADDLSKMNVYDIPVNQYSASLVRNLVKFGLQDKFTQIYFPYLGQPLTDELYRSIQHGLRTHKDAPKSSKEEHGVLLNTTDVLTTIYLKDTTIDPIDRLSKPTNTRKARSPRQTHRGTKKRRTSTPSPTSKHGGRRRRKGLIS